ATRRGPPRCPARERLAVGGGGAGRGARAADGRLRAAPRAGGRRRDRGRGRGRGPGAAADRPGHEPSAVRGPRARAGRRVVRRGDRVPAVRRGLPGGVTVRDAVAAALVVAGVAIELFAALGVVLMRDALDRLHYAGASLLGAVSVCLAVVVAAGPSVIGLKALLT